MDFELQQMNSIARKKDLLDQFAAAALTGLLASESNPDESVIGASFISYTNTEAAARAYAIAEAMLEERNKRTTTSPIQKMTYSAAAQAEKLQNAHLELVPKAE